MNLEVNPIGSIKGLLNKTKGLFKKPLFKCPEKDCQAQVPKVMIGVHAGINKHFGVYEKI